MLGIPLLLGIVKPNRFYGFRTGATLRDDRKWYQANVFSGGALVLCGLAISILSLLLAPLSHGALAYGDYKLLQGSVPGRPLAAHAGRAFRIQQATLKRWRTTFRKEARTKPALRAQIHTGGKVVRLGVGHRVERGSQTHVERDAFA
ncbi:MAG: SdpI family protein [Vulcanimicrobiaceae bacterium]